MAGASGAAGAPDDPRLSTATGFCEAYQEAYAENATRCFGAPVPADVEAAFVAQFCDPIDGLVAARQASYDRADAAGCLAQIRATWAKNCLFDDVPCASKVVAGALPNGAACTNSAECQGDSLCDRPDHSTCAPMVCTPRGGFGDPCGIGCDNGLICAPDGSNVCIVDRGSVGAPCDPTMSGSCDFTLSCRPGGGGVSRCVAAQSGDPCFDDFGCPAEDFCSSVGFCTGRMHVGASCAGQTSGCIALATCDPLTLRCVTAGALNTPCGEFDFCFGGGCTHLTDPPVCLVLAPSGTPCDDPAECASGVCEAGRCVTCAP
jgi:hypothetical protein